MMAAVVHNKPALGSRVTIAGAQTDAATGRRSGIVQSVIYGQTKDAIVLERCAHHHRTVRTALACGRALLRARVDRAISFHGYEPLSQRPDPCRICGKGPAAGKHA